MTAAPRRYGFHATLKPPMALAHGLDRLIDDTRTLVRMMRSFVAPALRVSRIDGFLAIVEAEPSPALRRLADECVVRLDHHRVRESAERVTKRQEGLDAIGRAYLAQYGYPYVLDRWRFHMTLSQRIADPDRLDAAARAHFAASLAMSRSITGVAIYLEPTPGAAFDLVTRLDFGS
ncbi:DUF1045 domain-containing protein [Acidiphilium sp.]|uniref:DUF1045 domain-containing protein n=1 Tax=Acidiphilium sp. TaxID=527 RepID=UPI003D01F8E3